MSQILNKYWLVGGRGLERAGDRCCMYVFVGAESDSVVIATTAMQPVVALRGNPA